jgi:tetratricopeptide (TPR) repeat protein
MNAETSARLDFSIPESYDEALELRALARALTLSEGFSVLFAQCNQSEDRKRLITDVRASVPDLIIREAAVYQPVRHLLNDVLYDLAEPHPDAIFVYGLEAWLLGPDDPASYAFIANLRASRDHFPKVLHCPLVIWAPEHVMAMIAHGAPDFYSVRSGFFAFESGHDVDERGTGMSRSESASMVEGQVAPDVAGYIALAGQPYAEKLEKIPYLEGMLRAYQELPEDRRDPDAEARILGSLGDVHYALGDYRKAASWFTQALAIREKTLGPEHPKTAEVLNALGALSYEGHNYAAAQALYQRALMIREKALGGEHPDAAQSLNNLAGIFRVQGDLAAAETLYRQALTNREKTLGPEHPYTAASLNNLAGVYCAQDNYAAAEPLYRRALTIREKTLGPEHPDTAQSLNNLAEFYYDHGNYVAAEPLHQRALAIVEKSLGPEHPITALAITNYAALLHATGRDSEAEALESRADAIRAAHAAKNAIPTPELNEPA